MNAIKSFWHKNNTGKIVIIIGGFLLLCIICGILSLFLPNTTKTQPSVETLYTQAAKTITANEQATKTPEPVAIDPQLEIIQNYLDQYGGKYEVYTEIINMTDCEELQKQFDMAASNNEREEPGTILFEATLGYMAATDDHMREIGCYN